MKKWTFVKPESNRNDLNDVATLQEYYNNKTTLKVDGHEFKVYSYTVHLLTNDHQEIIDDAIDLSKLVEPFYFDTYWTDNIQSSLFECLCDTAEDVAWLFKKLNSRTGAQFSNETHLYFKKHPELLSQLSKEEVTVLLIGMMQNSDAKIEMLMNQLKQLNKAVSELTEQNQQLESKIIEHKSSLPNDSKKKAEAPNTSPGFF